MRATEGGRYLPPVVGTVPLLEGRRSVRLAAKRHLTGHLGLPGQWARCRDRDLQEIPGEGGHLYITSLGVYQLLSVLAFVREVLSYLNHWL